MLVGKPVRKFIGKNVRAIFHSVDGKVAMAVDGKLHRDERNRYQILTNGSGYCFFRASDVHGVGFAKYAIGGVRQIFIENGKVPA